MRKPLACVALCGFLALWARPAWAHAFPTRTRPAVGSTVLRAPGHVTIWYTMALQPGLCRINVRSLSGQVVSSAPAAVDPKNPLELQVPLKTLAPGQYKVSWHVLASDGHLTQGHFRFRVAKGKPAAHPHRK